MEGDEENEGNSIGETMAITFFPENKLQLVDFARKISYHSRKDHENLDTYTTKIEIAQWELFITETILIFVEKTKAEPQGTFKVKVTLSRQTFSFDIPLELNGGFSFHGDSSNHEDR